ncbi:MAG: stage III sporulation protein AC [Clostridia bacterium]|nr:stage III sporulation protein AC [Clostridia bacterium]
MDITIILKIAGVGILVAVICQLLKQTGREDMAMLVTLAGLVITLMIVIDLIGNLLNNVRQVFELY